MIEHNRLDLLFERIRQLISIPAKNFDAIKFTRIMGSCQHNACVRLILAH